MKSGSRHLALWIAALAGLALPACFIQDRTWRGALLPDAALRRLQDGVTTRAAAARDFGPPSSIERRGRAGGQPDGDGTDQEGAARPSPSALGPFEGLPPGPGDVLHVYLASRVEVTSVVDVSEDCKLCLPTVKRWSRASGASDTLFLLFDERTGVLRAHAHLRDGLPWPPSRGTPDGPSPADGARP